MKLFKGKPTLRIIEEMNADIEAGYSSGYDWLHEELDDKGFVTGFFVADNSKDSEIGFIVGGVVEANDEYIALESWIPVYLDTVEEV